MGTNRDVIGNSVRLPMIGEEARGNGLHLHLH